MNCRVEQKHPLVTTVHIDFAKSGDEQWFLLRSDAHHDNVYSDHALERKHLQQVVERKAGILDFGDLHCCMQGRWDPRADQDQLRPELRGNDYLTRLMDYCGKFYEPYAANWLHLSPGNHETSVLKRQGIDLTTQLAQRLQQAGSPVVVGPYRGWVRFRFTIGGTQRTSRDLYYIHGSGGGGPVTKGIIAFARQLNYIDADFVVSGHTHDSLQSPRRRERLNPLGRPEMTDVECIKLGNYKDEFTPGQGWGVEKEHEPKCLGAQWLQFRCEHLNGKHHIVYDVIRAH